MVQASSSEASSVQVSVRRAGTARSAARSTPARHPLRRLRGGQRRPVDRPRRRGPRRSASGSRRRAGPGSRRHAPRGGGRPRADGPAGHQRAGAVVDEQDPLVGGVGARGPGRRPRPRPAGGRRPSTTADDLRPQPGSGADSGGTRSGAVTTTIRLDLAARGRTRPASRPAAAGRRPSAKSLSCAAHPRRAAGGDDDGIDAPPGPRAAALNRVAAGRRSSCRPRSGGRA